MPYPLTEWQRADGKSEDDERLPSVLVGNRPKKRGAQHGAEAGHLAGGGGESRTTGESESGHAS